MKVIRPESQPSQALVLLHGYMGNQHAMDIFARKLKQGRLVISPQAVTQIGPDQYTWADPAIRDGYSIEAYQGPAKTLHNQLTGLLQEDHIQSDQVILIGFSQGAALAYTLLALYPNFYKTIIALSGFLPKGTESVLATADLWHSRAYISHGIHDHVVPVDEARRARDTLQGLGVEVAYCEGEGKHKISLGCLKDIETYLNG